MKVRESGMPEEQVWQSFFHVEELLTRLGLTSSCNDLVEFGCGYGTFTIPAAQRVRGKVYALDIEPEMHDTARRRAESFRLTNIDFILRDFISDGTGLPDVSVDYAMVFNILHTEKPVRLLREAYRTLRHDGLLGIIHWNYDPDTPRGPPMDIRPRPEQCKQWAEEAGFVDTGAGVIDLPPYHYGLRLRRKEFTE